MNRTEAKTTMRSDTVRSPLLYRTFYGVLAVVTLVPLFLFGWLLFDTIQQIARRGSQDFTGAAILIILLLLLTPLLGVLAWNLAGRARDGSRNAGPSNFSGAPTMLAWIGLTRFVFAALLLFAAVGLWLEGNIAAGIFLGAAPLFLILKSIFGLSRRELLGRSGLALNIVGLLWVSVILRGLGEGRPELVLGGALLWLAFTCAGLLMRWLARR